MPFEFNLPKADGFDLPRPCAFEADLCRGARFFATGCHDRECQNIYHPKELLCIVEWLSRQGNKEFELLSKKLLKNSAVSSHTQLRLSYA
jgi:hypothetical protein